MKSEVRASAKGSVAESRLRQVLISIIGLFEGGAAEKQRNASISALIDRATACDASPREIEELLQQAFDAGNVFFEEPERVRILTEACESWYRELAAKHPAPSAHSAPKLAEPAQLQRPEPIRSKPPQIKAADQPWQEVVKSVRSGLLGFPPSGLGSVWEMPRKIWSSPWAEAYRVASFAGEEERRGLALIPTELAADAREAESWWRLKIEAAAKLKAQARPDARLAKVIDHGTQASPSFVLLEWDPPCGSLIDFVSAAHTRSLRDEVEIALAWCELLTELGRRGVLVVDLPPPLIHQRWSSGQQAVFLADPTAVVPASHLLPELRARGAVPPFGQYRTVLRDQVFLVGALLLACIRRHIECLQTGVTTRGPSASFASVAGLPGLSSQLSSEVLPSVRADLEKHPKPSRVDIAALSDTLRWSLAESSLERPATLEKLAADLRSSLL